MKWNLFKEIDLSNKMTTKSEIIEYEIIESSSSEEDQENLSDKELTVFNDNPEKKDYFIAHKIATLMGYTNTKQAIQNNVKDENKISFKDYNGIKEPKLNSNVVLITKDGIEDLLMKKKELSSQAIDVLSKINIDVSMFITEKESDSAEESEEEEGELTTYSYINNGYCFEYFVGFEITTLLGYKKPTSALINVSKSNKIEFRDYPGVKKPILDPQTILITRDGAIEILIKTRKRLTPDVLHILKTFHIDTTNRKCLTKEQQTLSSIANTFKAEKIEDQFKVGNYYLDMYFPEYKLVIECDENGHADRKPCDERERMDFVNKELGTKDNNWIRFNPDEFDFDMSRVTGRIYNRINSIKEEKYNKVEKVDGKKERHVNDPILLYQDFIPVEIQYNDLNLTVNVSEFDDDYYINANSLTFKTHRLDKWMRQKKTKDDIEKLSDKAIISKTNKGTWITIDLIENFGNWLGTINEKYKDFGSYLKNNLVPIYHYQKDKENDYFLRTAKGFVRANKENHFINVTDMMNLENKDIKGFLKTNTHKNYKNLSEHYISGNTVTDDFGIKVTYSHPDLALLMLNWIYKNECEIKTDVTRFINKLSENMKT
jgi:very-short-patch-repair endonuclease/prophage antirepressor-like protein